MKTKGLLCAVAFAAGMGISIAQSNVTNISVYLRGGGNFSLICNPLNSTNNDTTNLFRFSAQDGDQAYRWNSAVQDLEAPPYWDPLREPPHFILRPGEAVFYLNAGNNTTQTFVGEVIQTPYTNPIPFGNIAVRGGGLYNAYGPISPVAGNFTNALIGLPATDGDQIFFWDVNTQDFDPISPIYSAYSHAWYPSTNVIQPGIGFFYLRAGPDQAQWVRNFTAP